MNTNFFARTVLDNQEKGLQDAENACIQRYGDRVLEDRIQPTYINGSLMCPAFWDRILCWPDATPGSTVIQECSKHFVGFIQGNASRECMPNGVWKIINDSTWTNYTTCVNGTDLSKGKVFIDLNRTRISDVSERYSSIVQIISATGYTVSFVTLIIAFAVMLFIRKLHCARNILHMHLFASFILRALTFFIIKSSFVDHMGLSSDMLSRNGSQYFDIDVETNNWPCKLMTSLWQYFITANHSWILMEGLYLHNLIFRALFADSSNSIKWYVVMGWGLPLIVIGVWIAGRLLLEDSYCWTTYYVRPELSLIITVPTFTSVLLNLCLFMRISVVLYHKLRSPINEDSGRYQKWFRSTLVLVPLFGANYVFFVSLYYFIRKNQIVEIVGLIWDQLFGSLQGFFVAILYCFLNSEVRSEIQPHCYYFLTFLATNKYSKSIFPWRKKFLRSVVGRASVCTTMSCSSLYTNGILHRNSKCRLDSLPKIRVGDRNKDHSCYNPSRRESKRHSAIPTTETALCIDPQYPAKRRSEADINEETLKMVVNNDF